MDGITPPNKQAKKPHIRQAQPTVLSAPKAIVKKRKKLQIKLKYPIKFYIFKYYIELKKFYTQNQVSVRISAAFFALIMVFGVGIEIIGPKKVTDKYDISAASTILPVPKDAYAAKISLDAATNSIHYNKDYQESLDVSGQISGPKFSSEFKDDETKQLVVTDVINSTSISLAPQFGIEEPKVDKNRVIYPINGINAQAVYTLRAGSVKEDIILNKYQKDEVSFAYKLELPAGTESRQESDGSISVYGVDSKLLGNVSTATEADQALLQKARDSGKKTQLLFSIPKPIIVQANKQQSVAKTWYTLEGNILTVHANNLKDATYPLSIDPSVYVETATKLMRGNNESNIDFDVANELIQKSQTTGARIDSWLSTTNLSSAVWGQGTAVAGGYIYSVGGIGSSNTVSVPFNTAGTSTFTVPAGVTTITAKAWGGAGGGGAGSNSSGVGGTGGGGGYAKAVINVTPAEDLTIRVGAGGAKATANQRGGSGGEASNISRSATILLEAGAGAGGGGRRGNTSGTEGDGGAGGGATGQQGRAGSSGPPGLGGAAGVGGNGGNGTGDGANGVYQGGGNGASTGGACGTNSTGTGASGTGGIGGTFTTTCQGGGGGGGGYYGGGGGASTGTNNASAGGGGGGSSYANPAAIVTLTDQLTVGSFQTPGNNADSDRGGLADGGAGGTNSGNATAGENGIIVISYTLPGTITDAVYWAKFNPGTNAIESPNPGDGVCSGWCTDVAYKLPVALKDLSLVAYNGFLHAIGGANSSGTPQTTVYIAKIGANGEPQLWHPTGGTPGYWYSDTALGNARSKFAAVAYNNRMYVLGGLTTSTTVLSSNTVQYANMSPNGVLTGWTSTGMQALSGSSGGNRYGLTAHIYNDVLYTVGGNATFSGTPVTNVDYSKLNSNGTMNPWVQTSSMVNGGRLTLGGSYSTIFGGYLYVTGGCTTVNASGYCTAIANDVQLASINADGSLSEWNTVIGLANDRFSHTLIAWQGGLYRLGGCRAQDAASGGCTDTALDVDYGVINPDGEASTVATSVGSGTAPCSTLNETCNLPAAAVGNMLNASVVVNGYLYIMGGCTNNACTSYSDGVTYQAIGSDGTLERPASCSGTYSNSYCDSSIALPSARGAAGVAVFNNRIYLIGGFPNIANISYTSVNSDGSINAWSNTDFTTIAVNGVDDDLSYTYAYARANPANAGSVPGNLFIFGGCTTDTSGIGCTDYSDSVYKCDLSTAGVPSNCTITGQLQIGAITGNDGLPTGGGLGAHAGAVYANYIYLMGGLSVSIAGNGTDLTYVRYAKFDDSNNVVAVSGGDWIEGTNEMSTGRRRGAGFGYNGYLYVLGGYDGVDAIADIEFAKINVSDGSWGIFDTSSVSIQKRWALTVSVTNSYAYVIGGCTAGPAPGGCTTRTDTIQTFQIYNNDSGAIKNISNFSDDGFATNANRWGASSAIRTDPATNISYLYVAGGCISATDCTDTTSNVQFAEISATDGSVSTWSDASNHLPPGETAPNGRAWGKLVYVGGTLYYLGGQDDTATNEQSAIYYASTFTSGDITAAWSTASGGIGDTTGQAAQARTKFGASVWDDRIYVVGGLNGSATNTNTVYISPKLSSGGNIAADSWQSDTDVPDVARFGGTLITYANNLYYFGGSNGTNYLNDGQVSTIGYKTGTIAQSGTTLTGSGTTWTNAMVGSKVQYPDGSTSTITGFTSTTVLTVDVSKSVTAGSIYTIQDGSIGAWVFTTSMPNAISQAEGFAANGYLYLVGGRSSNTSCTPNTMIAPISANTTIATGNNPTGVGEWSETNVRYAGGRYGAAVAYEEGKVYITGGGCTSPQSGTYNTGTIGQSTTTVTGSGTNWTDNYIGGTITYQDASTATIVSVNSTTSLTVSVSKTVTAGQTYSIAVPRHQYGVLKSQPQVAIYSRMIDTDTDVFPTKWLMNGIDNSIGARWQLTYRSMHDINPTLGGSDSVLVTPPSTYQLQQNPNEDCGTSSTMPAMTGWGQETDVGGVTLGVPGTYTPKESAGGNINCARYFYFYVTIDASKTFGYPEDVQRGPTISDLSLFFTADPSKRMRHGKTFTGGELQPLDTPF